MTWLHALSMESEYCGGRKIIPHNIHIAHYAINSQKRILLTIKRKFKEEVNCFYNTR